MPDDDLKDRYAARLDDDSEEQSERNDKGDGKEVSSQNSMNAENDVPDQNVWNAQNVKNDWKGWTVYLPETYLDDVQDESKLLDVRLDRDVKMDRHFKPLLIALGMERLEGMEDEDVTEFIERMERGEIHE